jgi:hypothetical protein
MSSAGTCGGNTTGSSNAQRSLKLFAVSKYANNVYGVVSDLSQEVLRSCQLWEPFAGFPFDGYIIASSASRGRHLAAGSVEDVMNTVNGLAGIKFKRVG